MKQNVKTLRPIGKGGRAVCAGGLLLPSFTSCERSIRGTISGFYNATEGALPVTSVNSLSKGLKMMVNTGLKRIANERTQRPATSDKGPTTGT